ncbi:MAG: PIN domain-containing protein [Candidatus Woesearchaeota archaeon]
MIIYVDTNIYLDFLLRDKKKFGDPAFNIFKRTISCEFQIIVSDHLLNELQRHINPRETQFLFLMLKNKIIKTAYTKEDVALAKKLPTSFADALHIILAKKNNAHYMITRNKKDFAQLFESKLPEEL